MRATIHVRHGSTRAATHLVVVLDVVDGVGLGALGVKVVPDSGVG